MEDIKELIQWSVEGGFWRFMGVWILIAIPFTTLVRIIRGYKKEM